MNGLKVTALTLSVVLIASGLSGCTKTHVRTEKTYGGENYVREIPEETKQAAEETGEKIKTSTEHMKEEVKEHTKDWGPQEKLGKESTTKYEVTKESKQPHEAYSKEVRKGEKTEHKSY